MALPESISLANALARLAPRRPLPRPVALALLIALGDDPAATRAAAELADRLGPPGLHRAPWPLIRLMPLLHHRLASLPPHAHTDWEATRLRSMHKKTFVRMTLFWDRLRPALMLLSRDHTLTLYGPALAARDWPAPRFLEGLALRVAPWSPRALTAILAPLGFADVTAPRHHLLAPWLGPTRRLRDRHGHTLALSAGPWPLHPLPPLLPAPSPPRLPDLPVHVPAPQDHLLERLARAAIGEPGGVVDTLVDLALVARRLELPPESWPALAAPHGLAAHAAAVWEELAALGLSRPRPHSHPLPLFQRLALAASRRLVRPHAARAGNLDHQDT